MNQSLRVMMLSACVLVVTFVASSVCRAQQGGAKIVRVDDGVSQYCINDNKDTVWIVLRSVVTTNKKGWLTKDSSVATYLKATVVTAGDAKSVSFPLITAESVAGYSKGQVSIPLEYAVVNEFALNQKDARYSSLNLDVTLINRMTRTKWGTALQMLDQVMSSKKIPLPSAPLVQAGSYLLDFANSALDSDIAAQNKKDDTVKGAQISLIFDPQGTCSPNSGSAFAKTGTLAVLQADGDPGPGLVDLNSIGNYCWTADLTPAFVLKAAPKDPSKLCTDSQYHPAWQQVSNNFVAFVLNAEAPTKTAGPPSKEHKSAISRCEANGLTFAQCFPRKVN